LFDISADTQYLRDFWNRFEFVFYEPVLDGPEFKSGVALPFEVVKIYQSKPRGDRAKYWFVCLFRELFLDL
jgi:hypothetical protein